MPGTPSDSDFPERRMNRPDVATSGTCARLKAGSSAMAGSDTSRA